MSWVDLRIHRKLDYAEELFRIMDYEYSGVGGGEDKDFWIQQIKKMEVEYTLSVEYENVEYEEVFILMAEDLNHFEKIEYPINTEEYVALWNIVNTLTSPEHPYNSTN